MSAARTGRAACPSGRAGFVMVRPSRPAFMAGMLVQASVPRRRGSGAGGRAGPVAHGLRGKRGRTFSFSGVQSNNYWSSTTDATNPANAWNANLNNGNVDTNDKNNDDFVWPVRGGA